MGPLEAEAVVNIEWQWGANFSSCYSGIVAATNGNYAGALGALKGGQSHNPHVQQVYQAVNDSIGTGPLWDLVATGSLNIKPDLNKAKTFLEQQFHSNLEKLSETRQAWHAGKLWLASGLAQSMFPAPQGGGWMSLYRACIRDHRDEFFQYIDSLLS